MSNNRESTNVYNVMRGGQLFFSYFTMTLDVIRKNFKLFGYIWIILTVLSVSFLEDETTTNMAYKWALSSINVQYLFNAETLTTIDLPNGNTVTKTWQEVYDNKRMHQYWLTFKSHVVNWCIGALIVSFVLYCLWFAYMAKFGKEQSSDSHLRGGKLGDIKEHKKKVKQEEKKLGKKSTLSIANIPLPPSSTNTHFALIGAPSVGKSVTICEMLTQIREAKGKCFIYDRNGDFTKRFYREGIDHIINPNDERSVNWNVWADGCTQMNYRTVSRALVPDPVNGDPFWSQAARLVFEALCDKVYKQAKSRGKKPTMRHLIHVILRMDDEKMAAILTGTDAGGVFNMNAEKMASSIRATLATYIEPLKYQTGQNNPFSFRDWVNDKETDSWVFIPVKATETDLFKPLITVWAEQFAKALLELDSDSHLEDLRHHLVIDEIASLQKVDSLQLFLGEGRKFGGNAILGAQTNFQLSQIYGREGAEILLSTIANYVIYRSNSPESAKWSSELLLKAEIEEVNDNMSVGHRDVRDSVGMNKSVKERSLVTPSEVINLPDLEGYIRLGKGYDVLKFEQKYTKYKNIAEPFLLKDETEQDEEFMPFDEEDMAAIYNPTTVNASGGQEPPFVAKSNKDAATAGKPKQSQSQANTAQSTDSNATNEGEEVIPIGITRKDAPTQQDGTDKKGSEGGKFYSTRSLDGKPSKPAKTTKQQVEVETTSQQPEAEAQPTQAADKPDLFRGIV